MQEITMSLCKLNNKQNSMYVSQCSALLYYTEDSQIWFLPLSYVLSHKTKKFFSIYTAMFRVTLTDSI